MKFLKQFKSSDEFNGFVKALQKYDIEKKQKGELDGCLGYEKYQKSRGGNVHKVYASKKVRTLFEESQISVPRDRGASFNPMIVPKHGNLVDGIENVIASLYAMGISNTNI